LPVTFAIVPHAKGVLLPELPGGAAGKNEARAMAVIWTKRAFLAFAGFLLTAALCGAVQAKLEAWPHGRPSLAGRVLIASPDIGDPRFSRTVILIVRHDRDGALGITLNRPFAEVPLAKLLESIGEKDLTASGKVTLFAGGPVQPEAGFVIHTAEYSRPGTAAIGGAVSITSTKEIFRDIAQNKGPQKSLIAFGYSGWGANQLEAELARHDWYTASADPGLIFDEKRERLWDAAMERRSHDL
jgi:putative transcriptional regulator